jgi:tetratricopeptide (TPR) repeat protein
MRTNDRWMLLVALTAVLSLKAASPADPNEELWHHRNLGKAFYENPTTQLLAVDEFKKALDLAPDSAHERVNYGLALLRAGKTQEGVTELQKAQKQDPSIPHTWFNLGIAYKRDSEYERAIEQFEGMIKLVPDEAVSHYNLAVLYKLTGRQDEALKEFEAAARLDPNLAGPHFQLYNTYRAANRADEGARELAAFQAIKKRQAGAAVPEDLEWSFFAEIYETQEPKAEDLQPAQPKFQDQVLPGRLDAASSGLAVLDAGGDGHADLLAWSRDGALLFKRGSTPADNAGLGDLKGIISIAAGDFNNDGFADLCVLTGSGAFLYENKKGTFQKSPVALTQGRYSDAVWIDYDHDGDLDLFLLGEKCALMRNNGSAGFSDQTSDFPFVSGRAVDGVLYDLITDTPGKDLVVVYQDRPAVLYKDKLAGKYEAMPLEVLPAGGKNVFAYDINGDGSTDIAAVYPAGVRIILNHNGRLEAASAPDGARGPIALADFDNRALADLFASGSIFRGQGQGRFASSGTGGPWDSAAVATSDFNEDGRVDVVRIAADGSIHLLINQTETPNRWLRASLLGVKNAKLAPGAIIEVKAGPYYQKRTYQGIPLVFGVRTAPEVDTVRITWPNGLIQNQPKQASNKAEVFKEAQRLSGSCPMIFAWNGKEFEFVTDVLGVAPLGASSGDGKYFPLDHDEYIQIPGKSLIPVNGNYELRITEELHEVSYIDQVQLIAVDHPSGVGIFTNDKFKSPPFPDFRLFGVKRRIYPKSAREDNGRDVTSMILKRDRVYPDGFRRTYSGVADMHHLDLDFGNAAPGNRAVLILNGWVDWADGSTFLAAAQEKPGGLVLPYVQVKDAAGTWKTVIPDMGIPSGKPKTIAVDLTGKFLSSSREVRIVTNLCVYWDEIFLSEDDAAPTVQMTPINAQVANLRFRGFSQPTIHPERKQPESFNYSSKMLISMWNPTPGLYTHYGDVRDLLESIDDRMVIMGSGDEVRLLFPAADLPALRDGWTRDFLLLVDGWAKDADPNTAFSQTVEPLPFHGMIGYPYFPSQKFPDDEVHRLYRVQSNTRPALSLIRPLAEQNKR